MPENKKPKFITITVSEYHYLTKASVLLEMILRAADTASSYSMANVLDAAKRMMEGEQ